MIDPLPTNLAGALCKVFAEIDNLGKNKTGRSGNQSYRYTDLAAWLDLARPLLAKHGLGVIQFPRSNDKGELGVATVIFHGKSGEAVTDEFYLAGVPSGPKAAGGVITYLRRYALCSMLGVIGEDEDDDATHAESTTAAPAPSHTPPAPAQGAPAASDPEVPFGKNKGTRASQLSLESLRWYANADGNGWEPFTTKPDGSPRPQAWVEQDLQLQAAFKAAYDQRCGEVTGPDGAADDDIPF